MISVVAVCKFEFLERLSMLIFIPETIAMDVCGFFNQDISSLSSNENNREDSKSLEPEWKSAVAQSEKPLLSIDCVSEAKLCEKHEIISYPAIRLFRGDESVSRYRGPRKVSS